MSTPLKVPLTVLSAVAFMGGCANFPTEEEKLENYPKAVTDCEVEVKRLEDNRLLYVSGVTLASLFVAGALNDPDSNNDAYFSPILGAGFGVDIYIEAKTDIDCILDMRPEGMSEQEATRILKGNSLYAPAVINDDKSLGSNPRVRLPAMDGIN